ncbi:MAG: hypothetical protein JST04_11105 [Bdellovibrionales bacterium]|nr:hypothetical protein [Bdellovibrionales bacterium]
MRWNCPHCEELVTAGIDFENTKKAYVRCAKCKGMALVHRSAVLADYVKARRLEEEAQLEVELRLTQTANATTKIQSMESQIRDLTDKLSNATKIAAKIDAIAPAPSPSARSATPPPPNAAMMTMNMAMDAIVTRPSAPPPFVPSFESIAIADANAIEDDVAAAPPVFAYAKPPAFLLKPTVTPIDLIERAFPSELDDDAIDEIPTVNAISAEGAIDDMEVDVTVMNPPPEAVEVIDTSSSVDPIIESTLASEKAVSEYRASLRPMIALWVAIVLAIGSGIYLYHEGKQALSPVIAPSAPSAPTEADSIRSKANSAVRAENVRTTVIVRVPRAVLRASPGMQGTAVQTLDRSAVANLVEEKDGWMKIESPRIGSSDRTAWVRADLVTKLPN